MELVRLEVLMALTMKKTCCKKCCHFGQGKFSNTLEQPAACTSDVEDGGSRLIWHFGKFLLELHTATTQKTASFLKETLCIKTQKRRLKLFILDIFPYNHILLTLFSPTSVTHSIGTSPTNILHSAKSSMEKKCICCQSAMNEPEYVGSPFTCTQYVVENNNCSSNIFCQCCVPQISSQQYSVQYNLLKIHLSSYLVCKVHSRLRGTSFITNKYRSNSLSIWSPSTTHNSDWHFVLYQFTWCVPYTDFPSDIFLL